jgi:hypothetical protein
MQGVAMNRDIVKGNWKQFTGVMKGQWGRLTDRPGDEIAAKGLGPAWSPFPGRGGSDLAFRPPHVMMSVLACGSLTTW